MKQLDKIFYFLIIMIVYTSSSSQDLRDEEWYQKCVYKAAESAKSDGALMVQLQSCDMQSVPKICRGLKNNDGIYDTNLDKEPSSSKDGKFTLDELLGYHLNKNKEKIDLQKRERSSLAKCISKCNSANLYSKNFGDCSKG